MIGSDRARDLAARGARIRVHSGAVGYEHHVMAEGRVVGYCPAPSLIIQHPDGHCSQWSVDLPIDEIDAEQVADA